MPLKFDTIQVHGGHQPDRETYARAVPIYQSSSFVFENAEHAAELFALNQAGNIYTRIGNPTTAVLEERVALLEGGVGAVATASGTAAILYAIMNLTKVGDEIVASKFLYGGTTHLFDGIFKDFGVTVHLVDIRDPNAVAAAINGRTRAVFTETIGNPTNVVADIAALADIAHDSSALRSLSRSSISFLFMVCNKPVETATSELDLLGPVAKAFGAPS